MNSIFKDIYSKVSDRIFGRLEALNVDIHPDIVRIIKNTHNRTLEGKMFKIIVNNVDIYIIRELDSFIYMDSLFVNNKRSVVCSIPYDLYNYEQKTIVEIVKALYNYICNQLIEKEGTTLYNKIISLAPSVLTLFTLQYVCDDLYLNDFIDEDDEFKEITEYVLNESLSYSIQEVLDDCLIISIIEDKIKEEINNEKDN